MKLELFIKAKFGRGRELLDRGASLNLGATPTVLDFFLGCAIVFSRLHMETDRTPWNLRGVLRQGVLGFTCFMYIARSWSSMVSMGRANFVPLTARRYNLRR